MSLLALIVVLAVIGVCMVLIRQNVPACAPADPFWNLRGQESGDRGNLRVQVAVRWRNF